MATKKITLNELRRLVKQVIKENSGIEAKAWLVDMDPPMRDEFYQYKVLPFSSVEEAFENQINENKELFIHLTQAEDDPEHLVYALFDKDGKIIKSDFEDTTSAERWADENGYVSQL